MKTDVLGVLDRGAASILGRPLLAAELRAFERYSELILQWQRIERLVGSTDPAWIVEHLFLDSLLFVKVLPVELRSIADLGSGAGLPGVPLAIVRPTVSITLIEARERRASFLSAVVRELELAHVRVVRGRAEQVASQLADSFDAVVMRCAGDAGKVLPVATRLISRGGLIVVAGPPTVRPAPAGEWIEVPGVRTGTTRRFLVVRK